MLSKELIAKLRHLEINTKKLVSDMLGGQYLSVFKGSGMAFSEVRPYQPGDEIRLIDWNVTARMNEAFVKIFSEERELTVFILVDLSSSLQFGSFLQSKAEVCAEVTAQIAFSAITNGDRVGALLFTDRIEKLLVPKRGRKHVMRLIADLMSYVPTGTQTNLSLALTALSHAISRRSVVFIVSDFLDQGFEDKLKVASKKHDLIPVVIEDSFERAFPSVGLVSFEDSETGERMLIDTSSPAVREQFRLQREQFFHARDQLFKRLNMDGVLLSPGEANGMALQQFFRARARRLRKTA
ncbi:MAG: DUF58 domain-containing protein [Cystobacterineae bacterium]|nr:DUF58 domain-containing protein [Cystobacterineae bacterium]